MKILIVEDIDSKAVAVAEAISACAAGEIKQQERAKSFVGAIRFLEENSFDLLILDLVLPMRDGESPNLEGGHKVLAEILADNGCKRPAHIICLTEYEEAAKPLLSGARRHLVHIIKYGSQGWQDEMATKIKYVISRIRDAESLPRGHKVDIGIVTSSPAVELQELLKLPGPFFGEFHRADALDYYAANWRTKDGKSLNVVACAAPQMGMTAAAITASKLIERWRPKFIVMTGITAGTKRKAQQFGDILVAQSAFDYGSGKIVESKNGARRLVPSPSPLCIDAALHAILQRWERDQLSMDAIRRAWYQPKSETPTMIVGLVATGAAVVQSTSLVKEILDNSRKVVGLEMEAYGIFHAAHLASEPKPRVLVAKSICDFGDNRKNDDWQQYAAFTSGRFVYEFFVNATELDIGK